MAPAKENKCCSATRIGLRAALLISFMVAMGVVIMQLLAEDTTISVEYEMEIPMPSVTTCPFPNQAVNVTDMTLVDFMNSNESLIESNVFGSYASMAKKSRANTNDLYGLPTQMLKPTQSITVLNGTLVKCWTFEPPTNILIDSIGMLSLSVDNIKKGIFTFEIHESGQSRHNAEFVFESVKTSKGGQVDQLIMRASRTEQVNTPKQPCFESNDHSITDCVNQYIEEKLGCKLPWLKQVHGKRQCDQHQDLEWFMDLMRDMESEDLMAKGCFKANCKSSSWHVARSDSNILKDFSRPNFAYVQLLFQKSVPVAVQRYSIAYGFSNFVADFGGYLGLLLGASLLSLYDDAVAMLGKACGNKRK